MASLVVSVGLDSAVWLLAASSPKQAGARTSRTDATSSRRMAPIWTVPLGLGDWRLVVDAATLFVDDPILEEDLELDLAYD